MTHDAERAYVAAMLESQRDDFDRARESMRADIDRLRESWSSGFAQQLADHEDRMRRMRDDHWAYLKSLYDDGTDEGSRTDVAEAQAAASGHAPAGPAPQQPSPHAAELERARAIRDMPMDEYAARRAELGVQSATSMNRLFGETR